MSRLGQDRTFEHGLRRLTLPLALLSLCSFGRAAVIHVDVDATGANNGASWANAYNELQSALAVANSSDEIWVAEGTYFPSYTGDATKSFDLRSGVAVYGGFSGTETLRTQRNWVAHPTVLSGDLGQDDEFGAGGWYNGWNIHTDNSDHVVRADNLAIAPRLDGFRIVQAHGPWEGGGGLRVWNSPINVANCEFWRNLAGFSSGGGMLLYNSTATVTSCTFTQNWCHLGSGGGIHANGNTNLTVSGSLFYENHCTGDASSGNGGGLNLYNTGGTTVIGCTFRYNQALPFGSSAQGYGTYGGGIHNFGSKLTVMRSRFEDNSTMQGGGIFSWKDFVSISNLFLRNHAYSYPVSGGSTGGLGGAICAYNFSTLDANVLGCTIVNNTAHETGGIWLNATSSTVSSSIIWNNSDVNGKNSQAQIAGTRASYCDIYNLWVSNPGEDPIDPQKFPHCFDYDPQFIDPLSNFELQSGSPCLDAGDKLVYFSRKLFVRNSLDLNGRSRYVDDPAPDTGNGVAPLPDIGCYERG